MRYSLESTENIYKDMGFCHLQENLEINMKKKQTNKYCNKNRNKCCKKYLEINMVRI